MPLIRTPDERFENLVDFPFRPHFLEIAGARVHYVDEGQGPIVLCLHGEPTWSYLYRKMIPILSTTSRVIAPDFIGFGRSDKYTETSEYSFQMHRDTLVGLIEALDLTEITLVVQDWGGLIGLRVAAEMPERFARLVVMNTFLPTGEEKPSRAFLVWKRFATSAPKLRVGRIIRLGTVHPVPAEVIRSYEAPFPDRRYQAGAKIFPALVPIRPDSPGTAEMKATRARLREWRKPALVLFSDRDPILGGARSFFLQLLPTAQEQPDLLIRDAGHFLQEDRGAEIADHIVAFLARTAA